MTYTVTFERDATRALARIPNHDFGSITTAINALKHNPHPPGAKKLVGRRGWRIRVGNYRVIYDIDDTELVVTVIDVGPRSDIYR